MDSGKSNRARRNKPSTKLSVSWSGLSLALGIIAIASLGTLVVVVAIEDIDVLSTVALALAVLAFAAQIIISLAQAQTSAHQISQTERVNTKTRGLLSQISAQGDAMLAIQSQQFDRVLGAALGGDAIERAVREVTPETAENEKEGVGADQSPALDAAVLAQAIRNELSATLVRSAPPSYSKGSSGRYRWFVDEMTTYPEETEAKEVLKTASDLSAWQVASLLRRTERYIRKARNGHKPVGHVENLEDLGPNSKALRERGLTVYEPSVEGGFEARLTKEGRLVARLLRPSGQPLPRWLVKYVESI